MSDSLTPSLFEKSKATKSRGPQTRAYGTSNTGALRIHSDELKNSTDRLMNSETLMQLCQVHTA